MASLIKRGDVWYVAFREHGKQCRHSLKTNSKLEARRRFEIWQRKYALGEWRHGEVDCAMEVFWTKYQQWSAAHHSPKTVLVERDRWAKLISEFSPHKMGDISRYAVEKWKLKQSEGGANPVTLNSYLRAWRAFYNHARTLPLGDAGPLFTKLNPFEKFGNLDTGTADPKRAMTPEQIEKFLVEARKQAKLPQADQIHLVVALGVYAGLRKGELMAARWEWVDWEHKIIRVTQGGGFRTKTQKNRAIPLADRLALILRPHRKQSGFIYRPDRGESQLCDFTKSFRSVAAKAELTWVTPHTMRHSWITNLLRAGVPIPKVKEWAGHSSIEITVDTYGHLATGFDEDINRLS